MIDTLAGLAGVIILLALIMLRIPVAIAMFVVGFVGITLLSGLPVAMGLLASESFTLASKFELVVIPLFILMGNLATRTSISRSLYAAAYAAVGRLRGGLAHATLIGCGAFSALSGSSIASALTMGKVALGEMERYRYSPRLSTATVAAGGTLGILIPPSTGFVIYAILTEQSIGRLFLAGFLPGLLLLALFMATVAIICWLRPEAGPAGEAVPCDATLRAMLAALPGVAIIAVTIGGLYTGLFSPVESAAVGAGLMAVIGLARREIKLRDLWDAGMDSALTSATVMLILIGAHLFNPFMALSHIPQAIGGFLTGSGLSPWLVMGLILLCYVVLGMFMDGFAMLVLTLPIFFPVITALGFDPIWFGVIVMVVLEMGLLSPPVGMNVFIVHSIVPKVPQIEIYRGIVPFWLAMVVGVVILSIFPAIATALPDYVMGASLR
ncbi:C4-dicarboxylate transporter, DctM subunit [Ketogulonicigenium robustum]|uniref:TRAP transporter large permease protein n=1 Tax=Ketogulonicigenium robustum TaxID=92947 RepID=A0A1W6P298_9RHOB|nr:TRAP transporter large permease [Ketogulonicigenium robustum]ARO15652.1 C4-dicarboxylate transporter, DctM subunit [Ketogulonicigenium robustum]